jgi:hypothetical protein
MSMKSPCKFQSQINQFLCNNPDGPLKASELPQCLIDNDKDVRTSEQHRPDARSIIVQHEVGFQKSTLIGKSLQAVRMTWQHVRTLSSIFKIFQCSVRMQKGVIAKTVRTLDHAVRMWT